MFRDTDVVIGLVVNTWLTSSSKTALLQPLYRIDPDTEQWMPIKGAKHDFPNRGCITWLKAPEDAVDGSVWTFCYDEHPGFDAENPEHDYYRINWEKLPVPPYEVLHLKVQDTALLCAIDHGFLLPFVPSQKTFLVVNEQAWAGPLKLVKKENRWVIDEHQRNLSISLVKPVSRDNISSLKISDHQRYFLSHSIQPLIRTGEVDWSPDELVIKRVLEWLRQNRVSFANVVGLTKSVIKEVVNALPGQEQDILKQRMTRAKAYLTDVALLAEDIDKFEADLLAIPKVQSRIDVAKEQARKEAIAQAQEELEPLQKEKQQLTGELAKLNRILDESRRQIHRAKIEEQRILNEARQRIQEEQACAQIEQQCILAELEQRIQDETDRAQQALNSRQDELRQLDDQIAERQHQLAEQVELVDEALRERLAELVQRPHQALAEIAIMRAALGGAPDGEMSRSCPSRSLAVPSQILQPPATRMEDEKAFVGRLKRSFQSIGLKFKDAPVLHAAFLSGAMPLVRHADGLEALERYASTVAGGRWLWVNVPPTSMEPFDLLGRFESQSDRFYPHPSGLLDLLLHAAQPEQQDRLYVVVLDGVNRAAADAYLLPILTCYAHRWQNTPGYTLSLVHPTLIAQDDPYAAATHLQWPRNVLLAGTLIEGSATVPLPPAIWSHALLIQITTSAQASSNGTTMKDHTEVQSPMWMSWREQVLKNVQDADKDITSIIDGNLHVPATVSRNCAQFLAAVANWQRDDAVRHPTLGCLIPYGIASQQDEAIDHLLEQTTIDAADLATLQRVLA